MAVHTVSDDSLDVTCTQGTSSIGQRVVRSLLYLWGASSATFVCWWGLVKLGVVTNVLSLAPHALHLGDVAVGSTSTVEFSIRNWAPSSVRIMPPIAECTCTVPRDFPTELPPMSVQTGSAEIHWNRPGRSRVRLHFYYGDGRPVGSVEFAATVTERTNES